MGALITLIGGPNAIPNTLFHPFAFGPNGLRSITIDDRTHNSAPNTNFRLAHSSARTDP
jgi:hypothetical protein